MRPRPVRAPRSPRGGHHGEPVPPRHGRLRRQAAGPEVAERRPARPQLRLELRGGLGVLGARRRRLLRGEPHRGAGRRSRHPGPRPRRGVDVRVRQPRRLLAHPAAVPRAQHARDGLRAARSRSSGTRRGGGHRSRPASTSAATAGAGPSTTSSTRPTSAATSRARSRRCARRPASARSAGTAATARASTRGGCWSRRAASSTTPTPTTTSCRTGRTSAAGRT